MNRIDSDLLRIYVVWLPVLSHDSLQEASEATVNLDDPRVVHFWSESSRLAEEFRAPLGLREKLAWDVYLLYSGDARWEGAVPPIPVHFMHNWDKVSPPHSSRFNGVTLAEEVSELLGSSQGDEKEESGRSSEKVGAENPDHGKF